MQLLLLWLKVLIFHSGCSQILHSQEKGRPEIMIPLKIIDSDSNIKSSEWVSYSMKLDGLTEVVHIKVIKHLLARNMPVFTYTDQGALQENHPFIQNNSYYYGYIEGDPFSHVFLNICFGGFQGILHKNNTVYKLEPKLNSSTFEHLVYKLVSDEEDFPARRCGLTNEESQCEFKMIKNDKFSISKQSGYVGWWTHKRYLKLALVVGNNLYHDYGSNTTVTKNKIMTLFSRVYKDFVQLDLTIILMGIEIWTDKHHINYDLQKGPFLNAFQKWKEKTVNLRISHNVALLLCNIRAQSYDGNIFKDSVCRARWNSGVIQIKVHQNIAFTSFLLTRSVGITVGIGNDEEYCTCGQPYCIMNEEKKISYHFSNCSYSDYQKSDIDCLLMPPATEDTLGDKRCGNAVLEEGEDCDCGTISSCANDPCCEANCKLALGSVCAFGLCCRKCKFLPAGTLCRKKENDCDLPEWCNGTYHDCPEDVYVQGGISCKGDGFCYRKRCKNRQEQCRSIFGNQAKSARLNCYKDVNSKGDRFGNCGYSTSSNTPCPIKDFLCGRIQCENVNIIPQLQSHSTLISTNINGVSCWGIDYHFGSHTPDVGEVEEGTECGENHICVDRHCVPMSYFTIHCSPEKCRMRGICNNRHHCHCYSPWRPPYCYETGMGGSIDSGPPPESNLTESQEENSIESEDVKYSHICSFLPFLRFIVFLLIFIGLMLKEVI
ncbi:disintegrin and metalloproteinase domain-containing protein 20-like [Suncus etruscus]|uniref:disintegrin and metalloproteinase domain-containing protein 20-like n=1 Tax=Suncus etruscus TaxID=109475 RepID=UPI002110D8B2|nr:disintegrin and metalloproteinase domain-containing protein 20-like [Suncus etruscus]